jgi:hypothetical protein
MDVYLVPIGRDRHELYCEIPDEPETEHAPEQPKGFFRRLRARFSEMLAEAERERLQSRPAPADPGWAARVKRRTMCWVAESIAEQRLLWHLRRQTAVTLYYPDDLDERSAMGILRSQLSRDFDKHRFWLIIDAILFALSGLLALLPGPNLLAYYFAFRLVGHYLSMRGAQQALKFVTWHAEKSAPLADLRRAIDLEPSVREGRVREVAGRLRLEHLPTFFERTVVPLS